MVDQSPRSRKEEHYGTQDWGVPPWGEKKKIPFYGADIDLVRVGSEETQDVLTKILGLFLTWSQFVIPTVAIYPEISAIASVLPEII